MIIEPISVEFPLKGDWNAFNSPGDQVPSHGVDFFGQTYAYDFIRRNWQFPESVQVSDIKTGWSKAIFGLRLNECMAWSEPIAAPFSGTVVEAEDGIKERNPVHIIRDVTLAILNGINIFKYRNIRSNKDLQFLLGNYLIIKGSDCYAMLAHCRENSICVKPGDTVNMGQKIAEVGHSGNSTSPHLHFQLMDRVDLMTAKGLPCCFREYELYENNEWKIVNNGMPKRSERMRTVRV